MSDQARKRAEDSDFVKAVKVELALIQRQAANIASLKKRVAALLAEKERYAERITETCAILDQGQADDSYNAGVIVAARAALAGAAQ